MARRGQKRSSISLPSLDWTRVARWALALGLFALMGGAAGWGAMRLTDPTVLPLKVVRIDGRLQHLKRADIERAVGAVMRGNFFTLDVTAVRAAAGSLPWVDQVSVRRVWPDTLRMRFVEQEAFARWGQRRLVNPRGQIFEPRPEQIPDGLPLLQGPDDSGPRVVQRFRDMRARLAPLGLDIARLELDARGAWQLALHQGLELALGNADTEQRLQRFVQVYPRLNRQQGKRLKRVDLRYTNGFAVHWIAAEPELEADKNPLAVTAGRRWMPGAAEDGFR